MHVDPKTRERLDDAFLRLFGPLPGGGGVGAEGGDGEIVCELCLVSCCFSPVFVLLIYIAAREIKSWSQSVSDWLQMGQNRDFFKMY